MPSNLPAQLSDWLAARDALPGHRQLLVISGSDCWARTMAGYLAEERTADTGRTCLWVGEASHGASNVIAPKDFRQVLGQEFDTLVYDAYSGLRASAMMALSGVVRAGGLMVLVVPAFSHWPHFVDPEFSQRTSFGFGQGKDGSRFCRWLINGIVADKSVAVLTADGFEGKLSPLNNGAAVPDAKYKSPDQQRAVEAITGATGPTAGVPLLISADRGRGKSSALGIAAAALMADGGPVTITVTAPVVAMTAKVFEHCARLLPDAEVSTMAIRHGQARLVFKAIDALLTDRHRTDIVFIDEAAAIPAPQLKALTAHYDSLVFTTTIHGYEGTGRGFEYRFKPFLQSSFRRLNHLHLTTPIRWGAGDCLEIFWFRTFLMIPNEHFSGHSPREEGIYAVTADALLNDPGLLTEVFQLLVQAHYQTTPDDIVRILDGEDTRVIVSVINNELTGVALLAEEGGKRLGPVARGIAAGTRRVKGHLSPQKLTFEWSDSTLASIPFVRVVRIAVKQDKQNIGIGSKLLAFCSAFASQTGACLTTSFGANDRLLRFWMKNHFTPVHLGIRRDASSAEFSILMVEENTAENTLPLPFFTRYFDASLAFSKARWHKTLDSSTLALLTGDDNDLFPVDFASTVIRQIEHFVGGTRPLDATRFAIAWLLASPLLNKDTSSPEYHFVASVVIEETPIDTLRKHYGVSGKKELTKSVRDCVGVMFSEWRIKKGS